MEVIIVDIIMEDTTVEAIALFTRAVFPIVNKANVYANVSAISNMWRQWASTKKKYAEVQCGYIVRGISISCVKVMSRTNTYEEIADCEAFIKKHRKMVKKMSRIH